MGHPIEPHLNLLAELRRRQLTKVEVARRMEISVQSLASKCAGRSRFSLAEKYFICTVILGVDYENWKGVLFEEVPR